MSYSLEPALPRVLEQNSHRMQISFDPRALYGPELQVDHVSKEFCKTFGFDGNSFPMTLSKILYFGANDIETLQKLELSLLNGTSTGKYINIRHFNGKPMSCYVTLSPYSEKTRKDQEAWAMEQQECEQGPKRGLMVVRSACFIGNAMLGNPQGILLSSSIVDVQQQRTALPRQEVNPGNDNMISADTSNSIIATASSSSSSSSRETFFDAFLAEVISSDAKTAVATGACIYSAQNDIGTGHADVGVGVGGGVGGGSEWPLLKEARSLVSLSGPGSTDTDKCTADDTSSIGSLSSISLPDFKVNGIRAPVDADRQHPYLSSTGTCTWTDMGGLRKVSAGADVVGTNTTAGADSIQYGYHNLLHVKPAPKNHIFAVNCQTAVSGLLSDSEASRLNAGYQQCATGTAPPVPPAQQYVMYSSRIPTTPTVPTSTYMQSIDDTVTAGRRSSSGSSSGCCCRRTDMADMANIRRKRKRSLVSAVDDSTLATTTTTTAASTTTGTGTGAGISTTTCSTASIRLRKKALPNLSLLPVPDPVPVPVRVPAAQQVHQDCVLCAQLLSRGSGGGGGFATGTTDPHRRSNKESKDRFRRREGRRHLSRNSEKEMLVAVASAGHCRAEDAIQLNRYEEEEEDYYYYKHIHDEMVNDVSTAAVYEDPFEKVAQVVGRTCSSSSMSSMSSSGSGIHATNTTTAAAAAASEFQWRWEDEMNLFAADLNIYADQLLT